MTMKAFRWGRLASFLAKAPSGSWTANDKVLWFAIFRSKTMLYGVDFILGPWSMTIGWRPKVLERKP